MSNQQGMPDAEPARTPGVPGIGHQAWSPSQGQLGNWQPPAGASRPYIYPPGEGPNPAPVRQRRKRWREAGGTAAAGGGVAAKAGLLTKLFLLFKASTVLVKFKFLATMLISVVVYSFWFGWWFALGFVVLIAVHELGHMVALRTMGIKSSLPTFVPLMGAFVTMKSKPKSVAHEAASALAGPAVGTLGALAALELSYGFHSQLLRALAYTGFFLNLFNLVPALPLDGGRVAGALHPALWFVGLGGALVWVFIHPSPILFLILVFGGLELAKRWRSHRWVDASYYAIPPGVRVAIGSAYVTVAAVCLWGMSIAYIRHR